MTKHRYGKIKVTKSIYSTFWNTVKNIIPYRVEFNYCDKSFHIECECSLFDLIDEGEIMPEYYLEMETKLCNPFFNSGKIAKQVIKSVKRL